MEVRPLDASDPDALGAWHATYLAASVHGLQHATPFMLEEVRANFLGERTGERFLAFGGYVDGRVVTTGQVSLPMMDNQHLADVLVCTHPDARRRGHGSAMLDHLTQVVRAHGRSLLTAEVQVPYDVPPDGHGHPNADFALHRGFELDISNVVRVLDLPADEARVQRLADEAAPHHTDYALRQFRGRIPDDIVEPFGALIGSLVVEAPSGEVTREPEAMSVERIRADEAVFEASGRTKYTTVAVAPDGRLAAFSELVVPRYDPGHVFQWGTLVAPGHRGHRLGMATKAHNLLWLMREEPGPRSLLTFNAEVNRHMIAVNEALGFRPVEREVELHKTLA